MKITHIDFIGARLFHNGNCATRSRPGSTGCFHGSPAAIYTRKTSFRTIKTPWRIFIAATATSTLKSRTCGSSYPTPDTMAIQFYVYEGRQYHVGAVTLTGATLLPAAALSPNYNPGPEPKPKYGPAYSKWASLKKFNKDFKMKTGDVFTPDGLDTNTLAVRGFLRQHGIHWRPAWRGPGRAANSKRGYGHYGFGV